MDIFLSWSGERSFAIAKAIQSYLENVLQLSVFVSDEIEFGRRWSEDIHRNAREAKTGIVILLPENYQSPWILYEAGLITATEPKNLIVLRFGGARLSDPLNGLKEAPFNRANIARLIAQLAPDDVSRDDWKAVESRREAFWPKLNASVKKVLNGRPQLVDGLHHTNLMVKDLEASARFYSSVLGLRPIKVRNKYRYPVAGVWFEVSKSQQLHLILETDPQRIADSPYNKTNPKRKIYESPHVAFATTNFNEVMRVLRSEWEPLGYEVKALEKGIGPFLQSYTRDPDGYVIDVNQAPP